MHRIRLCRLHQRFQSGISRILHQFNAAFYNNAVFLFQFHHIPDCRKRCKLEQFQSYFRLHDFPPVPALFACQQRKHKLVCHNGSANLRKRVTAVLLLRIHNRPRLWHSILSYTVLFIIGNFVMVCHNDRHPKGICKCNLFVSGNPVVAGDHRVRSGIICLLYQVLIQSVTVAYPVRN